MTETIGSTLHGDDTAALTRSRRRARPCSGDRRRSTGSGRGARRSSRRSTACASGSTLGVDHTVVALVGGTGSGKSSLFNAICRLEFADVGRPTADDVGDHGVRVGRRRRTRCSTGSASCRTGGSSARACSTARREAPLRGLVLLDLPDHDSIAPGAPRGGRPAAAAGRPARLGRRPAEVRRRRAAQRLPASAGRPRGVDGRGAQPGRHRAARRATRPGGGRRDTSSSTTGSRASRSARRPPAPARGSSRCASSLADVVESRSLAARRAGAELNDAAALLAAAGRGP